MSWMIGRATLLTRLLSDGVINKSKPHHLLGVGLPVEGWLYKEFDWIESVDTSNPIVHGIKGIKYDYAGLSSKESIKLVDLLNVDISREQLYDINHNINYFKSYWK
jgi:hypothetical protein